MVKDINFIALITKGAVSISEQRYGGFREKKGLLIFKKIF